MKRVLLGIWVILVWMPGCNGCAEEKAPEAAPRFVLSSKDVSIEPEEKLEEVLEVAPDPDEISFTVAPAVLRVYRPTTVSLKVQGLPATSAVDSIVWTFEDGTPDARGASVRHKFEGGLSTQKIDLVVKMSSGKVLKSTKTMVLDRLPVGAVEAPRDRSIPPKPLETETSVRVVFVGKISLDRALKKQADRVFELQPDILVILGEYLPPADAPFGEGQWDVLRKAFIEPAKEKGVILLATPGGADLVGSRGDKSDRLWKKNAPDVDFFEGSRYPEHYAFRHKKVFITTVRSDVVSMKDEIKRVEASLDLLSKDDFGLVLSHLPPAPWTTENLGHLPKAYRLYEGLIRRGVRMMATGHYGVTYLARYGALKVVSGGRLNVPCDVLPDGTCTPASVVVVDVEKGKRARTFAVDLDRPMQIVPSSEFPEKLPFYERWEP